MKRFLIVSTLLVSAVSYSSAYACEPQVAQFIGKVKEHKVFRKNEDKVECFYKIEFSKFKSSMVCPLDIDEVLPFQFQDVDCNLSDGNQISGILSKFNDKIVVE